MKKRWFSGAVIFILLLGLLLFVTRPEPDSRVIEEIPASRAVSLTGERTSRERAGAGNVSVYQPLNDSYRTHYPEESDILWRQSGQLGRVFGRVTNQAGQPVGGALVLLLALPADIEDRTMETGPDGSFSFDDLEGTQWRLSARKGNQTSRNHVNKALSILMHPDEPVMGPVNLVLETGFLLSVRVVDEETGNPLENVLVEAPSFGERLLTDSDGLIRLAWPREYVDSSTLLLKAAGYVGRIVNLSATESSEPFVVSLTPAGIIELVVRDPDGNGLQDVRISYSGLKWMTDFDGRTLVDGFEAAREQKLFFAKKGYQGFSDSFLIPPIGERALHEVVMMPVSPEGVIWGRVVDARGEPLDALLTLSPDLSFLKIMDRTGGDGSFSLQPGELFTQKMKLVIRSSGMIPQTLAVKKPSGINPQIDLGSITMSDGHFLAGHVVDDQGNGIHDAHLFTWLGIHEGEFVSQRFRSDRDGSFYLFPVPTHVELRVYAAGYSSAEIKDVPWDTEDMTIVMQPEIIARGRVIDTATDRGIARFYLNGTWIAGGDGEFRVKARPKPEGVFFRVNAEGYTSETFGPYAIDDLQEPLLFRLEPKDQVLEGWIVDPLGNPRAGVWVVQQPDFAREMNPFIRNRVGLYQGVLVGDYRLPPGLPSAVTNEEGHFVLENLPRQDVLDLVAFGPGSAHHAFPGISLKWIDGEGPKLVLRNEAVVLVKLLRDHYPNDLQLTLRPETSSCFEYSLESVWLPATDVLRLGGLPDGCLFKMTLTSRDPDFTTQGPFDVNPVEDRETVVDLRDRLVLNGRLFVNGIVAPDRPVQLNRFMKARTDANGFFTYYTLKPGSYMLTSDQGKPGRNMPHLIGRNRLEVVVSENDDAATRDFRLEEFGRMTGRFDGEGLVLEIEAQRGITRVRSMLSPDQSGNFAVNGLPPGQDFRLWVRLEESGMNEAVELLNATMPASGSDLDLGLIKNPFR